MSLCGRSLFRVFTEKGKRSPQTWEGTRGGAPHVRWGMPIWLALLTSPATIQLDCPSSEHRYRIYLTPSQIPDSPCGVIASSFSVTHERSKMSPSPEGGQGWSGQPQSKQTADSARPNVSGGGFNWRLHRSSRRLRSLAKSRNADLVGITCPETANSSAMESRAAWVGHPVPHV